MSGYFTLVETLEVLFPGLESLLALLTVAVFLIVAPTAAVARPLICIPSPDNLPPVIGASEGAVHDTVFDAKEQAAE